MGTKGKGQGGGGKRQGRGKGGKQAGGGEAQGAWVPAPEECEPVEGGVVSPVVSAPLPPTKPNLGGRPPLLTPLTQMKIVRALQQGHFLTHAARLAGLHPDTVTDWVARGLKEHEQGLQTKYAQFAQAATQGRLAASSHAVEMVQAGMREDWRAAAWYLNHGPDKQQWAAPLPSGAKGALGVLAGALLSGVKEVTASYTDQALEGETGRLSDLVEMFREEGGTYAPKPTPPPPPEAAPSPPPPPALPT
jgi:hypothetical protein